MMRDFKLVRRNSGKHPNLDEMENIPVDLNTVEEREVGLKSSKVDKTPSKSGRSRYSDGGALLKTPDKRGVSTGNRFGWPQRNESSSNASEMGVDLNHHRNTPRPSKGVGRSNLDCNSAQTTPSKSVTKPSSQGLCLTGGSRPPATSARMANFAALSRGIPSSGSSLTVVNTVEVPHFAMKEDPSFWMDHNVQVLIRVRPLNSMEKSTQGYNRCLKQENAQCITWIGNPETRFTFDHVACESVDQETLFRMVGLPMVENCLSGYNSCMFAYGQTGSGKTYTMLGDIDDLGIKLSPNRGMTPRIFEFLFARIRAEEESRRDERLAYNCKCSFLEIYNEQITDLLDPSSTNLLIREDIKTGVYVENLSEFEVQTVGDILKLLSQGSSNRRVAATNMNRESSRSHSVFTCVIESRWEKDSTSNLRFARLNLVDLAGSERQKSSGAEGERLKEAANINKSLSTLGHVIMVLVDVAHAKTRHVPYRDSRLTFLLQDSLGGNSKTMIIANVSPSICSAAETLNTLKFAQRAKLIQNNAVVNEDSSGDVTALQQQIRILKEELLLLKRQNVSRSLTFGSTIVGDARQEHVSASNVNASGNVRHSTDDMLVSESKSSLRVSSKQLKSLETTLTGALRREQMAETSIKQLEAEIEQLNRLVRQREEDSRCTKMMLKFREDKVQRMEALLGGLMPADSYLVQENNALCEEIQQLRSKVDKNPEVTRFALENIRLLEQLRRYQDFYEEGERDMLVSEVSELRDQLLLLLDGNSKQHNHPHINSPSKEADCISEENASLHLELKKTLYDLEECRNTLNSCLENNAKLIREIDDLRAPLNHLKTETHDNHGSIEVKKESILEALSLDEQLFDPVQHKNEEMHEALMKHTQEILDLELELDIFKIILKEEKSSRRDLEDKEVCLTKDLQMAERKALLLTKQYEDVKKELKEAKSIVAALENQQLLSISEIEDLRSSSTQYTDLVHKLEHEISTLKQQASAKELKDLAFSKIPKHEDSPLQIKLNKMHASLNKAKRLNMCYQSDLASHASNEEEMDEVRRQVEAETAEVIVCLQEELGNLQQQVLNNNLKEELAEGRLVHLQTELEKLQEDNEAATQENQSLCKKLADKDKEIKTLTEEWESMTSEIEAALAGGYEALRDASDQLDSICGSFPQRRTWISEQLGRMTRSISDKELLIEELNRYLEDANTRKNDLEKMLRSLRGATLAITEEHQKDCTEKDKEIILLTSQLGDKMLTIEELERKIKHGEEELRKASRCATAAFVIVSRLSEIKSDYLDALEHKDLQITECKGIYMQKDALLHSQASAVYEGEKVLSSLKLELEKVKEGRSMLRVQLCEVKKRVSDLEEKLDKIKGNNIVETRERLTELKEGISALESCFTVAEKVANPEKENAAGNPVPVLYDNENEERTGTGENQGFKDLETLSVPTIETDTPRCYLVAGNNYHKYSSDLKSLACRETVTDSSRDVTVALLKEEIESAFDRLIHVQVEMAKLHKENKEVCDSEKGTQQGINNIMSQALALQADMSNFENQVSPKLLSLDQKLQMAENVTENITTSWFLKNESFEHELGDLKMLVVQKTAETSCILAKFKEAQDTITEADFMVNELMIANESKKNEIDRMKKEKIVLLNERDSLISEVQRLQSSNSQKDLSYTNLEKQAESDFITIKGFVQELEGIVLQAQTSCDEYLMSISSDFLCLRSQLFDSTKLVISWVEEIWSQIILKDCSMSVFHLCHMGILLETVTGLNIENGLLHRGLCQSNSLLVDLREHNFKSKRELQMCRVLEGKLLADIKNNFDRISRKEDETGKLTRKLTSFEKKILDLQKQEEIMLQRSNYMGSELATLMSELDSSNRNVLASLLDQEKMLKDKEDILQYREEKSFVDLLEKDFYLLVLASELKLLAAKKAEMENEQTGYVIALDGFKNDNVLLHLDSELRELILFDNDAEVTHLRNEIEVIRTEQNDLLSEISRIKLENLKLKEANNGFEQEMKLIGDVSNLNDALRNELAELTDAKMRLSFQFQELQSEYKKSSEELKMKERSLEISSSRISILDQQNQVLQQDISLLETSLCDLRNDLNSRSEELATMRCLEEEKESWKSEATKSKTKHCSVLQEVEEMKSEIESYIRCKEIADNENHRLQAEIVSLENYISQLQTDLEKAKVELNQCRVSESAVDDVLRSKNRELQIYFAEVDSLKEKNTFLTSELTSQEENNCKALKTLSSNLKKHIESVDLVNMRGVSVSESLNEGCSALENKFEEIQQDVNCASKFLEEFEAVKTYSKELITENCDLKSELERKDSVLEGLVFDLKLLQESASSNKDQKDEFDMLLASFESLENELDEAVEKIQILEAELQEKTDIISTLELDVSREHENVKSLSSTNLELTTKIANDLQEKEFIEKKLVQRGKYNENLKSELLELRTALEQMDEFTESLKINLETVTCEKDALHAELLMLKQEYQMAQNLAEENEAIAIETRQVAEARKLNLDEKEEEVRLLERSVEELERTVNVLESKVDIVKGEAELQRMQREDLEIEFQAIKQKMQAVESGNDEMKRGLDDKEKTLQEALQRTQILEREIASKDTEIKKCQTHISELNLHAEAQACEYKQKFKALEVMAEQVKLEGPTTQTTSSSINKLEKSSSRPRGSGSPFKCIGLGFVQQMKSERDDDELTSGRLRIEELEALAARRQKEIFMLNARLATAESMTHDVLRDLLGLKSDMTGYATLLDNQQVQKITEKAQLCNVEVLVKDQEVINLKKQLSEFVEERKGWLEEIDRKQAEIVAAQIALEELRQHHRLLTVEHEIFKMENVNHKKKVAELELEVKKLSGQQNIQQRIHHHAKIKEENNFLKAQNEELSSKLRHSEAIVSRVKEELSRFRASNGRNPCIHIDEEQRLSKKLKETEEERLQLAQKLLGLCTSILKAAGITRPVSDISLPMAEEALEQLKDHSNVLNRELQELKLKSRVNNERNRLSELMPQLQSSPLSSRSEGSRQSNQNTSSQAPYFTCLDR